MFHADPAREAINITAWVDVPVLALIDSLKSDQMTYEQALRAGRVYRVESAGKK